MTEQLHITPISADIEIQTNLPLALQYFQTIDGMLQGLALQNTTRISISTPDQKPLVEIVHMTSLLEDNHTDIRDEIMLTATKQKTVLEAKRTPQGIFNVSSFLTSDEEGILIEVMGIFIQLAGAEGSCIKMGQRNLEPVYFAKDGTWVSSTPRIVRSQNTLLLAEGSKD